MERTIILLLFLFSGFGLQAQVKHFHQSSSSGKAFRIKVIRNDTVIINEDSAYVYSTAMVEKIHSLEELYLSCLSLRDNDLLTIRIMLDSLQESYSGVNDLLNRSSTINKNQLVEYQQKIGEIISNLQHDVTSLQELQYDLANAQTELDSIKKEIKKERTRLWWKKTGSIFIAVIAGFMAGFIVASA